MRAERGTKGWDAHVLVGRDGACAGVDRRHPHADGFFSRDFCRLRCLALGANLNFIAYGWLADLGPVLALHLLLLPLNLWRLCELRRSQANSVNGA